MAKDPNKKINKEQVEELLRELDKSDQATINSVISHMKKSGGVGKGVMEYLKNRKQKPTGAKKQDKIPERQTLASKVGRFVNADIGERDTKVSAGIKMASGFVGLSPAFSSLLSHFFEKKFPKEKKKEKEKTKQEGISKQDMSKIKGDIIKNVANKIDKESGKIQDSIKDVKDQMEQMKSDLMDEMKSAAKASAAKIVKKKDSMGRTHYHDTATKKFTSKAKYEEQQKFQGGAAGAVGGSLFGLTKTVSNIEKEITSVAKIATKILEAVNQKSGDSLGKDSATKKGVTEEKAKDLGGMILKPDGDAHFLSPEMSFLEADEQERITRDALLEAFQDILKENPDAFKQEDSMLENIIDAAIGAALFKRLGGIFKGLKGLTGIGGTLVGAGAKIFGKGAATATAAAAGEKAALKGAETVGEKGLQTVGKETAETVAEKGAQTVGKEVAEKGAETVAKKAGTEVAQTAVKKGGAKVLGKAAGKTVLKSVLKKIPIIGLVAGLGFAAARAAKGDWTGAAMEAASGVAGTLPGAGTAASIGIDAALAARDAGAIPGMGPPPEKVAEETKPTPANVKQATTQTLAPAVNKTTTNVTNQTTVNKQAAPASATPNTPPTPISAQQTPSAAPTTTVTQSTTAAAVPDPTRYGNVITDSTGKQQVWDKQQKAWVPLDATQTSSTLKPQPQQTASLAPPTPSPVGQNIIQGNQNIATQTAAAAAPPPAAPAAAPAQVNVTQNTMIPPDKSNAPKIDMETSSSTMERLARADSDSPWAFANW